MALTIAVAAFPDRPRISPALAAGPLIEVPVPAVVAASLRSLRHRAAPS